MENKKTEMLTQKRKKFIDITILLAFNQHLYSKGLITKEEKEDMEVEILRTE